MTARRTLYEKICAADRCGSGWTKGHILLYVDRHLPERVHQSQAFSALRESRRPVWRRVSLAVVDHVNSTAPLRTIVIDDAAKAQQVQHLARNCRDFGIQLFDLLDKRQGIEHVVAAEQGFVLPGMVSSPATATPPRTAHWAC